MVDETEVSSDDSAGEAAVDATSVIDSRARTDAALPPEIGGRKGPEPTRYGDWEKNGRCIDF